MWRRPEESDGSEIEMSVERRREKTIADRVDEREREGEKCREIGGGWRKQTDLRRR